MRTVTRSAYGAAGSPISCLLFAMGTFIPLLIGIYWPLYWLHPAKTPLVFRPAVLLIGLAMAFLCGKLPLARIETKLAGLLALFCVIWLGTAFAATNLERALDGWLKIVALCILALLLSRALRHPAMSQAFGYAMIAASLLVAVFIIVAYVRLMGWTIPTYESSRRFKGLALSAGIPLNAIPFTAVMAYVTGMCLLRANRFLWLVGAGLLFVCSAFTGSRAPAAVLALTGLVLLIANGVRSRRTVPRYTAFLTCGAMLAGTVFAVETLSFRKISEITEGRWDLWYVAVQKFSEHPLLGYGFESVDDDLFTREPGVYKLPRRKDGKFPGGYHNEYLGTLAEEGLVGFIPVVAVFWFLMRSAWQLAFRRWATWRNGQWALVGALFLMIRAGVELPGLFGYANGPPDFLAYIFLALVASRFAIEEDCAKKTARQYSLRTGSPPPCLPRVAQSAAFANAEVRI